MYPKSAVWDAFYQVLVRHAQTHGCHTAPPIPLILQDAIYASDQDKKACWLATCNWAQSNGAAALLDEFYATHPVADFCCRKLHYVTE